MLVKDIQECRYFTAGDGSILCELLHPLREKGEIPLHCSIAHARLPAGRSTIPHRLTESAEVYYFLEGQGIIHVERGDSSSAQFTRARTVPVIGHVNQESAEVKPGRAVFVPPGAVQYLENTGDGDLLFLCIVDPMWREEDEEVMNRAPRAPGQF
jgi:mannose-6-phosphate isomerase-like protein (cupin superfamily)